MGTLLSYPKFFATDSSTGLPLVGGKLYTYINGSTTVEKATYSDRACSSPNTNPVILNARGEATIYLTGLYNLILKDSDDNTIWSMDNVEGTPQGSYTFYPSATEADHGATSTGGSLKDILTSIGTSTKATVIFLHSGASATTSYTVATTYDASSYSNVKFVFENGAILSVASGKTLTLPSPSNVDAKCSQQIFSGAGTVAFNQRGTVYIQWWGADPTGTTASSTACLAAVNSGAKHVDGANGLFYFDAVVNLPSNTTIRNMRLYDADYRTTNQHTFLRAVGGLATELTGIEIDNIEFLGNNSTYAIDGDVWAYDVGLILTGAAICFYYVDDFKVTNVKFKYMIQGMPASFCTRGYASNIRGDFAVGVCYTCFSWTACYDSLAENIWSINGGDGAIFIYNGVNCHIRDFHIKNTTPATYNLAGAGMESCTKCSLTNGEVENSWCGFAVIESALDATMINCRADGCHTGILVARFGYTSLPENVTIDNCRVTGITDRSSAYALSGILIYNDNASYGPPKNIKIVNSYLGRSNAGILIKVDLPDAMPLEGLTVQNCTIEGGHLVHFDWETQVANTIFNNATYLMYLSNVTDGIISGNRFRSKSDTDIVNGNIQLVKCSDLQISGNELILSGFNIYIKSDSNSTNIQIFDNTLLGHPGGGYYPFNLASTKNIVRDNKGWSEICNLPAQLVFNVSDYAAKGYNHFFAQDICIATLPTATSIPIDTTEYAHEKVGFKFACVAGTFTITPQATEYIRGEAQGASIVLTPGIQYTFYCLTDGYWEYY